MGQAARERAVIRRIDGEYGIWRAPGQPLTVEYQLGALEEIRAAVADGFRAVPRGGLEVGGILFGTRQGNLVQINAAEPIACEHAFGPSFTLSERDEAELAAALARRPDGLMAVGWYHSHTRSDLTLTERDVELHRRFFAEPWQVALVLHPEASAPMTAALFARGAAGALHAEPDGEFVVAPRDRAARKPAVVPAKAPEAEATNGHSIEPLPTPPPPPRTPQPFEWAPEPTATSVPEIPADAAPRRRWWLLAPAAVTIFLGGLALGLRTTAMREAEAAPTAPAPPPSFDLRAMDTNGQLRVSWDRGARPILTADRAAVEIADGDDARRIDLDQAAVRAGALTYARRNARVDVRMRVFGPIAAEEVASFYGQPPPRQPAAEPAAKPAPDHARTTRERDQARAEAAKLRSALAKQQYRNRQLEEAMRVLRHNLEVEKSLRRRR